MTTYGEIFRADAEAHGVPLQTLAQVRETLTAAKKQGSDKSFARLLLNHGRITEEAREFVAAWK